MIDFGVGDRVSVYTTEIGGKKPGIKVFSGVVIGFKGKGKNRTFIVRKIGAGKIGVERIFPLHSPLITRVLVKKKAKVRRAKLYYLRKPQKKKPASKRLL